MDNIPERESIPPKHREISLDEEFHPFEHERIDNDPLVLLKIGPWKLPLLIIESIKQAGYLGKIMYVNPFRPEDGYQFSGEDYDLNERKEKTARLMFEEGWEKKTIGAGYFAMFVRSLEFNDPEYLRSLRGEEREELNRLVGEFFDFNKLPLIISELERPMGLLDINNDEDMTLHRKVVLPLLKRLRLKIMVGDETLESVPLILSTRIAFAEFYPADKGPLPSEEMTGDMRRQLIKKYGSSKLGVALEEKGKRIALPKDLSRLEQVRMMFTLEESPKDVRETTQR